MSLHEYRGVPQAPSDLFLLAQPFKPSGFPFLRGCAPGPAESLQAGQAARPPSPFPIPSAALTQGFSPRRAPSSPLHTAPSARRPTLLTQRGPARGAGAHAASSSALPFSLFFLFLSFLLLLFLLPPAASPRSGSGSCAPEPGWAPGGAWAACTSWLSSPNSPGLFFFSPFPFFFLSFIPFLSLAAGSRRAWRCAGTSPPPQGGLRASSPPGHAALSMSSPPNSYSTGSLGTATATVLYALHLRGAGMARGQGWVQDPAGGLDARMGGDTLTRRRGRAPRTPPCRRTRSRAPG